MALLSYGPTLCFTIMLSDQVLPFSEEQDVQLLRVLTDRGTEYCGFVQHEYQLYFAIEDIDPSRTKANHSQTNGICQWLRQRFHKTIKDEFYSVAFRKKVCTTLEEPQADLNQWLRYYSEERPHSGRS